MREIENEKEIGRKGMRERERSEENEIEISRD